MPITKEEVADAVRDWVSFQNSPYDPARLAAMEPHSVGYGYRTATLRDSALFDEATFTGMMSRFWDQTVYYRMELGALRTSVAADVGFAWGGYTEEFQEKGRTPEHAEVRFSIALTKEPDGWKVLSYHRDIQPFDTDGRYPRSLTAI